MTGPALVFRMAVWGAVFFFLLSFIIHVGDGYKKDLNNLLDVDHIEQNLGKADINNPWSLYPNTAKAIVKEVDRTNDIMTGITFTLAIGLCGLAFFVSRRL